MRALLAALLLLAALPARADDRGEAQGLVDRSTLTVQELLTTGDAGAIEDARRFLRRARAALVCPRIFRAGFILGGEGGGCVLVARDAAGSWSAPAFYGMASGSLGLQIGVQDMQVLMLVMSDRALSALMDSQFKLGADASVAVATVGAGVEGATAGAGADIMAFARSRGLFAGIALEGSLLTARSELNRAYYGQDVAARQIVVAMQVHNPGADPLRAALMRYGAAEAAPVPQAEPAAPRDAPGAPAAGPVQSTPLPPIAGQRR
jgi:lipid-binding SYLF domain-containing protein